MDLEEARAFIDSFHRHNRAPRGWRFGVGASFDAHLVGVAVLGRTTASKLHAPGTAEVSRCCVIDGAPLGTCSFLYASLWRAWRAIGGRRLITYTLQSEGGASLRGAGATLIAELAPNNPADWLNRPGREWQPVVGQAKFRWEWNLPSSHAPKEPAL